MSFPVYPQEDAARRRQMIEARKRLAEAGLWGGEYEPPYYPGGAKRAFMGITNAISGGIAPGARAAPFSRTVAGPEAIPAEIPRAREAYGGMSVRDKVALLTRRPEEMARIMSLPREQFEAEVGPLIAAQRRGPAPAALASAGQQRLSVEGELIGEQVPFKPEPEKLIATYLKGTKNRVWTTKSEIIANPNLYEPMEETGVTVNVGERQKETATVKGGTAAIGAIMRRMRSAPPFAVGGRGQFASWLSGLVAQVSPENAEKVSRFIVDADPDQTFTRDDLESFRSNLYTTASANIDIITAEKTGRISEAERELAFRLLGVIGWSTDRVKVQAAMRTIAALRIVNDEILRKEQSMTPEFPLGTDVDIATSRETLLSQGFSEKDADFILSRILQAGLVEEQQSDAIVPPGNR